MYTNLPAIVTVHIGVCVNVVSPLFSVRSVLLNIKDRKAALLYSYFTLKRSLNKLHEGWAKPCDSAILGAITKLRKATNSLSCLSVRTEIGSHWTNFHKTWHFKFFFSRKSVEKIQLSLEANKNNGYFIYDNISLNSSYNDKRLR